MEKKTKQVIGVVIVLGVVTGGLLYYIRFPNLLSESILIESNQDFEDHGWPGNGTVFNPYVISGKTIYPSEDRSCIEIRNTTVFFTIESCYLESAYGEPALLFVDVENAKIQDCTIVSRARCISLSEVSSSTFTYNSFSGVVRGDEIIGHEGIFGIGGGLNVFSQNRFLNIRMTALYLIQMSFCFILNNTISNAEEGIRLSECTDSHISGNEIENLGYAGFEGTGISVGSSVDITVEDNSIHNNVGHGIQVFSSSDCEISENIIQDNEQGGIFTEDSDSVYVRNCTIANNGGDGIEFNGTSVFFRADTCRVENSHIHHNSGSGINFNFIVNGDANNNQIEFNNEWGIHMNECETTTESNNTFDSNTLGDVYEEP